jgi:arabinose-5-phosphate isomerase
MTPYIKTVQDSMLTTSRGIERACNALRSAEVGSCVNLLVNCAGNIIFTGIGKSGIVANKLSATCKSVGLRSFFLHPSDAFHGDIGCISVGDLVVLLSHSGSSSELNDLAKIARTRNAKTIAITGKEESKLSRNVDACISYFMDRESCPLNLAPTTSCAIMQAIGDGLVAVLVNAKRFTSADFAKNHPAGSLGKRLTLRVRDLMFGEREFASVSINDTLNVVVSELCRFGVGAVPVVDGENELLGIITDGDVRRTVMKIVENQFVAVKAFDLMTRSPVIASPDMMVWDALRLMEDRPSQISVLPVVSENRKVIGMLRLHDIARVGLQ